MEIFKNIFSIDFTGIYTFGVDREFAYRDTDGKIKSYHKTCISYDRYINSDN